MQTYVLVIVTLLVSYFASPACAEQPVFSVTGFLVPQPIHMKDVEWRAKRTRKATMAAQTTKIEKFVDGNSVESYEEDSDLFKAVCKFLQENPDKRLIFYIHGCCHLYPDTLHTARELAKEFDEPVLIYNWPSSPFYVEPQKASTFLRLFSLNNVILKHNGYSENEQGYSNGKGQFAVFFQEFDDQLIKNSIDSKRVTVVAHSMGNRLLDDEMEIRAFINDASKRSNRRFGNVVFACADVGMEEFQDFTRVKRISDNAEQTWFLINGKDPALKVSSKIHGYWRIGNAPQDKATALMLGDNVVKVVDHTTATGKDHGLPIHLISDMVNNTHKFYNLVPSQTQRKILEAVPITTD
jgi:hypothetical protein